MHPESCPKPVGSLFSVCSCLFYRSNVNMENKITPFIPVYVFFNSDAPKLFQKIWQHTEIMGSLTLSLHSVRNQLLAQGPMSQFSISFGRSFMLHSSSSTMSPRLLTHFTSRVLCPTPQGTEHCNKWQVVSGLWAVILTFLHGAENVQLIYS